LKFNRIGIREGVGKKLEMRLRNREGLMIGRKLEVSLKFEYSSLKSEEVRNEKIQLRN
jgi:hypothetical protein